MDYVLAIMDNLLTKVEKSHVSILGKNLILYKDFIITGKSLDNIRKFILLGRETKKATCFRKL